jgi:hypothetical protein
VGSAACSPCAKGRYASAAGSSACTLCPAGQTTASSGASSVAQCVAAGVTGDPQFVGFRGQEYQVHGVPGHFYSLVSTPSVSVNAEFRFLSSGVCPASLPKAECWTHPGTYVGSVGMQLRVRRNATVRVRVESGSVADGLRVYLNDDLLEVDAGAIDLKRGTQLSAQQMRDDVAARQAGATQLSASASAPIYLDDGFNANSDILSDKMLAQRIAAGGSAAQSAGLTRDAQMQRERKKKQRVGLWPSGYYVHMASISQVEVYTPHFRVVLSNSDRFLNQAVSLLDLGHFVTAEQLEGDETGASASANASGAGATEPIHGVLGQTVRFRRYSNQWRYIEGSIEDYAVDGLFDTSSRFNLFH